jgi:type IV secretion system protein VirB3
MADELRCVPVHRALHRPNLLLGGERELVLMTAVACVGIAVSAVNLVALGVGLLIWLVCIGVLRMMAKADPQMRKVYLRQLNYSAYYPARSRPFRRD